MSNDTITNMLKKKPTYLELSDLGITSILAGLSYLRKEVETMRLITGDTGYSVLCDLINLLTGYQKGKKRRGGVRDDWKWCIFTLRKR